MRADAGPPPARLQRIADQAAQSGDLRSRHPADSASCANAPWDELRVWDPGDYNYRKTAIAEGLAQMIADDKVPQRLKNKRLISLELGMLVADTKYYREIP